MFFLQCIFPDADAGVWMRQCLYRFIAVNFCINPLIKKIRPSSGMSICRNSLSTGYFRFILYTMRGVVVCRCAESCASDLQY